LALAGLIRLLKETLYARNSVVWENPEKACASAWPVGSATARSGYRGHKGSVVDPFLRWSPYGALVSLLSCVVAGLIFDSILTDIRAQVMLIAVAITAVLTAIAGTSVRGKRRDDSTSSLRAFAVARASIMLRSLVILRSDSMHWLRSDPENCALPSRTPTKRPTIRTQWW